MKSRGNKTLIILLSIIIVIIVIIAYREKNPKVKNLFDEMYYGESKIDSWKDDTPFIKIKGIKDWNRNSRQDIRKEDEPIVFEKYKNYYVSKILGKWKILFSFNFEKKRMGITFSYEIQNTKIRISINNRYYVDKKQADEEIGIYDKALKDDEARIKDIPKIKEYLEKNNISLKDLKETADELLFEKVIGDWEKYTNSRFSKDNLGTVKIDRSPLFDKVD